MKTLKTILAFLILFISLLGSFAVTADASSGAYLYSYDGETYLGELSTNRYATDSVFNKYGTYGSKYSIYSIYNKYGTYGSAYSNYSAFNRFATQPPIIVIDDRAVFYLTINKYMSNSINPYYLYDVLKRNGY